MSPKRDAIGSADFSCNQVRDRGAGQCCDYSRLIVIHFILFYHVRHGNESFCNIHLRHSLVRLIMRRFKYVKWISCFILLAEDMYFTKVCIRIFLNNTNLTFLAFLYKIDIEEFQNQQKLSYLCFIHKYMQS